MECTNRITHVAASRLTCTRPKLFTTVRTRRSSNARPGVAAYLSPWTIHAFRIEVADAGSVSVLGEWLFPTGYENRLTLLGFAVMATLLDCTTEKARKVRDFLRARTGRVTRGVKRCQPMGVLNVQR